MKKVYIKTFGCQMNEYDTDKMHDVLRDKNGYIKTENIDEADVVLLNTCSIREKAQEKVFSDLGRIRKLKNKKPDLIIGVGGCVASQEGQNIVARAPYVDLVFGPQTLHRLPTLLAKRASTGKSQVDIDFVEIEKFDHLPPPRVEKSTAYVSIMEGCSKYCSFCIVPYTRGEEVSRPFDDVLTEVADLADQGVKEINLLGQNVNGYMGTMGNTSEVADFAMLLETMAHIPGIERIRFTTSHPNDFSDRLISVYEKVPQLVNHLHLPVQSGSNRILTAMKRNYTAEKYLDIIKRVRAIRPNLAMSSDFIIGFPGETDEDFEDTMRLIDSVKFDMSFSFIYSARPGTPAADLADDTPYDVKHARLQRLQAEINDYAKQVSHQMVGTTEKVLVEGLSTRDPSELFGRVENNRIVNFKVPTGARSRLIGQMIDVKITDVMGITLRGDIAMTEAQIAMLKPMPYSGFITIPIKTAGGELVK
ncbi:tRNA (N6-isopentenyl adenosine(37)-C2)-methylthiotransferase MiaB [Hydromonas duriensis]|uniref:tRNA-2-methylthio-N(6)-dimethylallyladenosine synthase n=1 Tax=Hydromonas duriensis TaxID=1527608 RepID=A0A4R6Y8A7_9BURK|nr:tRNA (N6-isopentenyl adenosine(37)-C2)-methylthiotransferase MiaB [Hydromonas duriensis]TDR31626.1 tRNA-i(6)A37 thiotransferase enzyme MiaB [Hydromonas duriensis]